MKANMIRQAVDFLAYKGLGEIDFNFSSSASRIMLEVSFDSLTHDELIELKKVFGPLKAEVTNWSSCLLGTRKVSDDFKVELTISAAFECTDLSPDDLTDEKLDKLRENIMAGTIKVRDCTPKTLEAHQEIPF